MYEPENCDCKKHCLHLELVLADSEEKIIPVVGLGLFAEQIHGVKRGPSGWNLVCAAPIWEQQLYMF